MKTKIVVKPQGSEFILRTSNDFPIGSRLLTVAPEAGHDYPEMKDRFDTKGEADRAAMKWNLYLLWANKKRSKTKSRISE